jgi:hypothetical protein
MANRKVIYEACFEDYLRSSGVPYVAVDEAKKALFAGVELKSFDFVVYSGRGPNLLVDVKGRRFTGRGNRETLRLENWTTRDDLVSLKRWEEVFGSGFAALVVFCYHLAHPEAAQRFEDVHAFRGEYYGMVGVYRGEYADACRPRSRAWNTVSVPSEAFRGMARPVRKFF